MSPANSQANSFLNLKCENCHKKWQVIPSKMKKNYAECSNCHNKILVKSDSKPLYAGKSLKRKASTMRHIAVKYDSNLIKSSQSSQSTESSNHSKKDSKFVIDSKTRKAFELAKALARKIETE